MPGTQKPQDAVTAFTIKISGRAMDEKFKKALLEVVVDSNLHLPDMFTIQLFDDDLEWVDDSRLDLGKPVEITVEAPDYKGKAGPKGTLIKGEITALEPNFEAAGRATLLIRGYDKAHRLHRGKRTQVFGDGGKATKIKDSDIASKLAQQVGLQVSADASPVSYNYVLQNNQTPMEFLLARARRVGYQVYVDDGKLFFKKGSATQGAGPDLEWGDTLKSFRPRLTGAHQADKVIVNGWDPNTKKEVKVQTTTVKPAQQGGITKAGGAATKSAFGKPAEMIVVDQPVATSDEAKAMAQALGVEISGEFLQAEGVCFGDPRVKAGKTVNIKKVGRRFSGKYLVTAAMHFYRPGKYETHFTITARQPDTFSHLLDGHGHDDSRVQGVVTGLVTNNNDPANLGRVKVKFPWLGKDPSGKEIDSTWARLAAPMAGKEMGFYCLPEVNDEVLVAFEHGDVNYPYVVGSLWNNKDKPLLPSNKAIGSDKKVNQRIFKSRSGHTIVLNDEQGKEQIVIRDKTEKNEIIIDSAKNTLTINTEKDIVVTAKGKINFKATADVTLEGQNVTIKAQQNCKVEATQNVDVKATAQCNIQGTAGLTLKGAPPAQIALQGTVNVNNGALEVM